MEGASIIEWHKWWLGQGRTARGGRGVLYLDGGGGWSDVVELVVMVLKRPDKAD